MTLLVASIAVDTVDELRSCAERAWDGGADAVEVRIDAFADDLAELDAYLQAQPDHTWIVTCRSVEEGGRFDGPVADRVSRICAAVRETNAYVDFELADWLADADKGELRPKLLEACNTKGSQDRRLILSAHDFGGVPKRPAAIVESTSGFADVCCTKIAYHADSIGDSFAALDLLHTRATGARAETDLSAIAMGEAGSWTRVLAKKLGAFASYCTLRSDASTAPGQFTLEDMVRRYRWKSIDAATRVYGVLGDPVAHSMSPILFNHWFEQAEINAVYLPLRVASQDDALRTFLNDCREREWLDIGGFSVTVPHKIEALRWVGDAADPMARSIGALNTIVFRDGSVAGYNTDSDAAVSAMVHALGCSRGDLSGVSVDVLGTGGAARAVLHGLSELGCRCTVYGRSAQRTQALAKAHNGRGVAWEDRVNRDGEILINCTGVGMWPDVEASPMPPDAFAGCRLVFDLIYNPLDTRLMRDAVVKGVATLNGLDMFIRQAAMQFELWTGMSPDTRHARQCVESEIELRNAAT